MNVRKSIYSAIAAATLIASSPPATGQALETQRFGLYVLVDDVERSVAFYQALFGFPPQVRTPALVGFDVSGGLFAVVSRERYAPAEARAGSVRPFVRVADIGAAYEHVNRVAPGRIEGGRISREGVFAFFRVTDLDGNVIELFSLENPGDAKP